MNDTHGREPAGYLCSYKGKTYLVAPDNPLRQACKVKPVPVSEGVEMLNIHRFRKANPCPKPALSHQDLTFAYIYE